MESVMNEQVAQIKVRVPVGIRAWIDERAKANKRSKTAEIEFLLEEARRKDEQNCQSAA